jgi:hypothetical protein
MIKERMKHRDSAAVWGGQRDSSRFEKPRHHYYWLLLEPRTGGRIIIAELSVSKRRKGTLLTV